MFKPEDFLQDEIEHPEQTRQLRQSYPPSKVDQQSLLRIRTRLLEQRSLPLPTAGRAEEIQTRPELLAVGQFLQTPVPQLPRQKRPSWRLVALIATLCVVLLSGMGYALTHTSILIDRPIPPTGTPTTIPQRDFIFQQITMTSATTGWANVTKYSAEGQLITIARTTDGGKAWQIFDFHGQTAGLISAFFLNDQVAWVGMGTGSGPDMHVPVMHTIDGGQHWTTFQLPPLVTHLLFLDPQHGWAWPLDASLDIQASRTLYKTIDGGTTWTRMSLISTTRAFDDPTPGSLPFSEFLGLSFRTPQQGWAVLYTSTGPQRAFLYMTQNGGTTWQLQRLPQPPTGPIPGLQTALQGDNQSGALIGVEPPKFFTSQGGVLSIVSQASAQKPRSFYLYATSNGGQSWSPLGTNIDVPATATVFSAIPDLTHVLLTDRKTVTVYVLVEGQWQKQSVAQVADARLFFFVNSQLGWIYAEKSSGNQTLITLYTTSDGGQSWHMVLQYAPPQLPPSQGG